MTQRQRFLLGVCIWVAWMVAGVQGVPWAHAQAASGVRGSVDLTVAIEQVAKQTIPAVVHIEVTERQEVANPLLPFESDPSLRRFFNVPRMPKKFKRELMGLGTGMLMDAQGHILTNYHVAGGATKIEVLLANGSKYAARLVGTDPKTDLAVIKIEAKEALPFVPFGDSDKMEVGQWVVANGLPTICQPRFVTFLPHLHGRLTTNSAGIIASTIPQHGHQDAPQSVANSA
jgi:serine protease Do